MTTKRKAPTTLVRPVVKQNAKKPSKTNIDETRTAVISGGSQQAQPQSSVDTIEISSDSSSNYDDLSDGDEEQASGDEATPKQIRASNGQTVTSQKTPPPDVTRVIPNGDSADVDMGDADADAEPTFGDLIRGGTIDVAGALSTTTQQATPLSPLSGPQPRAIAPVSLSSLGTVLNQALKTDDNDLLESCLQTTDHEVVMATIHRMDTALAGRLLVKLAARMHRRPGRALGLMRWVQGTLIAHGGALAAQGDLVRRLADLNRVLEERSRGLTSLLALKGKLDMLDAQLKMRKTNKTGRKRGGDEEDDDVDGLDEDGEEGIIYVEGEENEPPRVNGVVPHKEEDDFPVINGMDSDAEEDSDENDGEEGLEEFENDSMDNDEVDHDDVEEESGEEDSEGEAARPPAKVQKVKASFAKRK